MDKDDFKAISVLMHDYPGVEIVKHLAKHAPSEMFDGRPLTAATMNELMLIAMIWYPGGPSMLQLNLGGW